jgi:hypothetical protein
MTSHQTTSARLLWWLLLPFLLAEAYADDFPIPEFTAQYSISRNDMTIGESTRRLFVTPEGAYIFESQTRATGFAALFIKDKVLEQSRWHFTDHQMIPEQYIYQRSGGKKERDIHLNFDWERMRVTNTIDQDPWMMPIPTGTLDKYLYQLRIMFDLTQQKQQLDYQVADGGKLKNYLLEVIGTERLITKLGTLETVILKRKNDKRQTTLWCAKEYAYLPVKITQIERDGARFKAAIKELKGLAKQ